MTGDAWGEVPDGTDAGAPAPTVAQPAPRPWSPVDPAASTAPAPTSWSSASTATRGVLAPRSRRRVPGVAVGAMAVAVVAAVVVGLVVVLPRALTSGSGARAVAGPGSSRSSAAPGSTSSPGSDSADRDSAIAAVLTRRGAAVTHDDATAWRRTQTAAAKAPQFDRLAPLPVTRWVYDIRSVDPGKDAATLVLDVRLHLRYDVDTTDAVVHERLTVRHVAAGWLVVTEATAGRRAQPWDLGSLTVVRGRRSLVIGIDSPTSTLTSYARIADAAVPDVSAVWGTGWNRRPVLVVPHTVAQLGRALGRTADSLEGYAAVTTGELRDDDASPALRVWMNTPSMADLSVLGRSVVVRHELTHVATDAPGTPDVPLWLEEGFAEYVGYTGSGIGLTDELRELVRAQKAGTPPAHLPTQATFDGADVDLAYEGADLACRVIVEKYGQKQLVRLYRLTVAGTGTEAANLEAALRTVTGSGTAALETAWHARLRALAS